MEAIENREASAAIKWFTARAEVIDNRTGFTRTFWLAEESGQYQWRSVGEGKAIGPPAWDYTVGVNRATALFSPLGHGRVISVSPEGFFSKVLRTF